MKLNYLVSLIFWISLVVNLQAQVLPSSYGAYNPSRTVANSTIVSSGLVLHLDAGNASSYPGSGTTWTDLAGSNNGTLTNGPTYSSANGGSIVFDGTDDYVSGNTNLGISGDASFSICYWARWDGASFSSNYPSGFGNNTNIPNRGLSTTWKDGRIALDFWNSRFRANAGLIPQTWYHVAFTKSPGAIGSTTKLYVNGQEVLGSLEGTNSTPDILDSIFNVGRLDSTRYFNGKITNIHVYNRVLSSIEVAQNFNAQRQRFGL